MARGAGSTLGYDRPTGAAAAAINWRRRAACRYVDPEIFFTLSDSWAGPKVVAERAADAKAVCAACPVRAPCLDAAYAERDLYAIRAGLTPQERKQLRLGVAS